MNAFIMLVSAYITTYLFRKKIDKKSFNSLGFSFVEFRYDFIHGCIIGIIMVSMGFLFLLLFGYLEIEKIQFLLFDLMIGGVAIYALAFSEEIVIRGYLLNNLLDIHYEK